ncbi:hypothetical protein CEXT_798251 [Caerostris extrusa]|uniref:Uncharacterized protein n=1 Tax=Caerostris extrusa TaxID=172846 RepID=A0AAV4UEE0_CAEEX|nr:hypothetical protein CEXT_798251 [Caerostris extrusa]
MAKDSNTTIGCSGLQFIVSIHKQLHKILVQRRLPSFVPIIFGLETQCVSHHALTFLVYAENCNYKSVGGKTCPIVFEVEERSILIPPPPLLRCYPWDNTFSILRPIRAF